LHSRIGGVHQWAYLIYVATLFVIYFFGAQIKKLIIKAYRSMLAWNNKKKMDLEYEISSSSDEKPPVETPVVTMNSKFGAALMNMVSLKAKA